MKKILITNALKTFMLNNIKKTQSLNIFREDGDLEAEVNNLSEKEKLEAVKNCNWAIEYISNPSKEVQLAAVKENPEILDNINNYIKNPCQEILDLAMIKDIIE